MIFLHTNLHEKPLSNFKFWWWLTYYFNPFFAYIADSSTQIKQQYFSGPPTWSYTHDFFLSFYFQWINYLTLINICKNNNYHDKIFVWKWVTIKMHKKLCISVAICCNGEKVNVEVRCYHFFVKIWNH